MDVSTMDATGNENEVHLDGTDQETPSHSQRLSPCQREDAASTDGEHLVLRDESQCEGSPSEVTGCALYSFP